MKTKRLSTERSSKLGRYEKVISILVKYGFEDILSHAPFNKILPQKNLLVPTRNGKKVSEYNRYERIRLACEELGTTFIKFAQIASNRPDLLPDELIHELEKLQDMAPPVPLDEIKKILDASLPLPLEELLEYFDEIPLASASMAQVHRARLIGGKEVVLKIQRPGIRKLIASDLAILKNIVSIIESYFPQYQVYHPAELVKMFEQSITEELNFRMEADNALHFRELFRNNDELFVPEIYKELSTEKILCMEFVDGIKITELEKLKAFNITGEELAFKGIRLYFEQVFEHGFFHADPHPGNIFVLKDGRISFIDFGMMGSVIESDKILFAKMLLSIYFKDVQALKKSVLQFSKGMSKELQRELEYDIIYFLRQYSSVSIEDIDGNEAMRGLNALFYQYKLKIPSNLLLLLKALLIMEGVGLKLNPAYDIIQNVGPYIQKLLSKKYSPSRIQHEVIKSFDDVTALLKDAPEDIREIIQKIKEGKLHIEFEHVGLAPVSVSLSNSINRLSFALLIVSIIIASALIVIAKVPPMVFQMSLLGIIGFGLAGLLALKIILDIGKYKRKHLKETLREKK